MSRDNHLVLAVVTLLEYPIFYEQVLEAQAFAEVILTLRSALEVALLAWTVVRLIAVPVPGRQPAPRAVAAR